MELFSIRIQRTFQLVSTDSIYVCSKTQTVTNDIHHTVKIKPRRWGLGITAGYGFGKDGFSPAVIAGISYRIW